MNKYILLICLLVSTSALAGGDKNNNPWQPTSTDDVSVFLPSGMDLTDCRLLASTQAGATYLCPPTVFGDEITLTVPTVDKEDDD